MLAFDINVQQQVIELGLDDSSPNAMLPNVDGGQYGKSPDQWRKKVVVLISAMLEAELVVPLAGRENYQRKNSEQIQAMLWQGDPDNGFDVDLIWSAMHFQGTPKLNSILSELNLNHWGAIHAGLSVALGGALAELRVVDLKLAGGVGACGKSTMPDAMTLFASCLVR